MINLTKVSAILLTVLAFSSQHVQAQSSFDQAKELQSKYKDAEMYILRSEDNLKLEKNIGTKNVIIKYAKAYQYLSLCINKDISLFEYYDNSSNILEFKAKSSLNQRRENNNKFCGTYSQKGIFFDDSKFCSQKITPKELGEIWDVNVQLVFNDAKYLNSIYFNEDYPLKEKVISITVPKDIDVEIKEFNFEGYDIVHTVKEEGSSKVITYTANNLPSIESVNYKQGFQFTYPHLVLLVKGYTQGNQIVNLISSVDDLYKWNKSLVNQLMPNTSILKPKVDELTANAKTDLEKIEAIYYWVQDNIRYIAFEEGIAGFKPEEAHKVYEKKYGDCKGMANLLKEMLKLTNIDARLTWIGTNSLMHDFPLPALCVNNHMICAVKLNDKYIFLDGTEKKCALNEYAERIQGRQAMIENNDSYIIEKVPVTEFQQDLVEKVMTMKIDGEKIIGSGTNNYKGESKRDFFYKFFYSESDKIDAVVKEYAGENSNFKILNVRYNELKRTDDVKLNYDFSFQNAMSTFNNETYVSLDFNKPFTNLKVAKDRLNDLYFAKKINEIYKIEFNIPDGYKLQTLPANLIIKEEDFEFKLTYEQTGNKILYTKSFIIPGAKVKKKNFEKWNASIIKLNKFYQEQITLTK